MRVPVGTCRINLGSESGWAGAAGRRHITRLAHASARQGNASQLHTMTKERRSVWRVPRTSMPAASVTAEKQPRTQPHVWRMLHIATTTTPKHTSSKCTKAGAPRCWGQHQHTRPHQRAAHAARARWHSTRTPQHRESAASKQEDMQARTSLLGAAPTQTASSASCTCSACSSACEYTATVFSPISWQARMTRTAISPRFAMSTCGHDV